MTLPNTTLNQTDDDSDMFGPPRTTPIRHTRPKVPMISAKLRLREERKRILQLCAHKLERIKDSEANLRRSVCINNTYSRLTDELRREKQSRYLANLPKSETTNADSQIDYFSSYNSINESLLDDHHSYHHHHHQHIIHQTINNTLSHTQNECTSGSSVCNSSLCSIHSSLSPPPCKQRRTSSKDVDTDLETLDRELNALDASMPLVDPEITQGAEQLEKAISRKRSRADDENDRFVRETLSQFYLPTQRLLNTIDDCSLLVGPDTKRCKTSSSSLGNDLMDFDLSLDHNQNQKEFEVIMDALRLGTGTASTANNMVGGVVGGSDSCGQAAMLSENGVFHNLVVASLET